MPCLSEKPRSMDGYLDGWMQVQAVLKTEYHNPKADQNALEEPKRNLQK